MTFQRRTFEDVGLQHLVRYRNRSIMRNLPLAEDRVRAPLTAVLSVAFLIPESDTRGAPGLPDHVEVRYPRPLRGWREKRIWAPVRVPGGILVRVLWWQWLKTIRYEEARETVADAMDGLYKLSLDPVRPLVAIRAALVDWDVGFSIEPRRLRDPWWAERSFAGIKLDTWNLKSWGIADGAPIQTADRRELRTGQRDTVLRRRERRGYGTPAVDPMVEKLGIDPAAFVRQVLNDFLPEAETRLPKMIAEAKKMPAGLGALRARQIMAILRTTYFATQVRERLFALFLEGYNDPERDPTTSARRLLYLDLWEWCWAEVRRRFL